MSLASFPQLQKLPKKQRLKLAEELWVSGIDDDVPVSPADRRLLDNRWRDYESGKLKRITLAELERRLAKR